MRFSPFLPPTWRASIQMRQLLRFRLRSLYRDIRHVPVREGGHHSPPAFLFLPRINTKEIESNTLSNFRQKSWSLPIARARKA